MKLMRFKRRPTDEGQSENEQKPGRITLWLAIAAVMVGFLGVLTLQLTPPDPESRLPASQRLPALISRQQGDIESQKKAVQDIRSKIASTRSGGDDVVLGLLVTERAITATEKQAGLNDMKGSGFTVTLNDSTLNEAPSGNVNDLVIHSQDVQAVVNALWASGAEAISINGERVVATSAILCVGNTLLLNGTVHAPPYEISAIGADRARFTAEPAVRRFSGVAEEFSLGFSIGKQTTITVPRYDGALSFRYANPVK